MFKYVLHRFFKNKKSYLLIVIIIITFLIMSISPYLTGSFVDFMINNKDVHRVVYLSSIIMLIGIAGVVLAYCKNTLSVKITSQVSFDLLRDITKHFEKIKLSVLIFSSRGTYDAFRTRSLRIRSAIRSIFLRDKIRGN